MRSGVRPRKRLGQHFLVDRSVAQRIVASTSIREGDTVLEIGPGEGILTEFLLASPAEQIVGVEVDSRLVAWLRGRFGGDGRFVLVEDDFLQYDLAALSVGGKKVRVVGNLPYAITAPILFRVLDRRQWVSDLTVTVQREVGERIASPPGCKAYGIPSVMFQAFSRVEILFSIPRHRFHPVPEVDSAVIRFRFFDPPRYEIEDEAFFCELVRAVFGQRRKMLKNTLRRVFQDKETLQTVSVDLWRRPEELSVSDFVRLSNILAKRECRRSRGGDSDSKR